MLSPLFPHAIFRRQFQETQETNTNDRQETETTDKETISRDK